MHATETYSESAPRSRRAPGRRAPSRAANKPIARRRGAPAVVVPRYDEVLAIASVAVTLIWQASAGWTLLRSVALALAHWVS